MTVAQLIDEAMPKLVHQLPLRSSIGATSSETFGLIDVTPPVSRDSSRSVARRGDQRVQA
jgi:hypothetical protein